MDFSLRTNKYLQIALLFFVFIILGLYFNGNRIKEKMSDMSLSCPNLLRQEGDMIMLYDLTQPGSTTNPAIFHNLAEYAQFVKEQQAQGIHCPILELQTQIIGSSISNIPPTTPSNTNENENIEEDKIRFYDKYVMDGKMGEFKKEDDVIDPDDVSDNPMDHNWGGVHHSAQSLASGKYDGNMVTKPLYFNIRQNGTSFDPEYPGMPPPPNYVPRDLLAKDMTTTK